MTKVIKVNKEHKSANEFIEKIQNKKILVYEDVQGSKICVKYTGRRFVICQKSIKNEELNFVDLTVQKFYNEAYEFFNNLPKHIKNLLDPNWWFIFEYFPDNQPGNIEYNRRPKNNLILTCIVKSNKYTYNIEEIIEYSNLFNIDHLPILFYGELTEKQIEVLNLFLNTSEEDLNYLFKETNFAKFFYDILNPSIKNSFLMNEDNFNDNIEKIIIKIDEDDEFSFEVLNPLYKRNAIENSTEYSEVYSLILINFLEFCQLFDFKGLKIKGFTKDQIYINLICKMFNEYIDNVKDDIIKWDFEIPQFFKEDKFKINIDMLKNKKTTEYVKIDPKIEYIFKVILGSFNKKRKKPIGVFNEQTVTLFNQTVDTISNTIDDMLKINKEYKFQKSDVLNFSDFFNIKFDKDSSGDVYPDVYDKMKDVEKGEDKKKGIKKGGEITMKKEKSFESVNFNQNEKYDFSKFNLGKIEKKIYENVYLTDNDNIVKITDDGNEAEICNNIIDEKMNNIIGIKDVFMIRDTDDYVIVMEKFNQLEDKYIEMTKSCMSALDDNNVIEEGNKCYSFFCQIKEIQDELLLNNMKIKDFSMNQFGMKNEKLVFVDFSILEAKRKTIEKMLKS